MNDFTTTYTCLNKNVELDRHKSDNQTAVE